MRKHAVYFLVVLVSLSASVVCESAIADGKETLCQSDFGIIPNSSEDQTDRIQKYLNKTALAGGGQAYLSAGYYVIKGNLTIPTSVALTGSWLAPHHGILEKGTVLHAYSGRGREDGPAFLEMQQSSAVRGLTILYPEQALVDVKPYPWTIHGQGMHNTVENVTLVNSYQGICTGPEFNELHLIRNVFGCVLRRGVKIDNCTDIGRIENVHFSPHYWTRSKHSGAPRENAKPHPDLLIAAFTQQSLEAFIFAYSDWEYVTNTFVFGAKVGYRFMANDEGKACNGQFYGIGADSCQYGVWLDKVWPYGILISNGQFVGNQLKTDDTFLSHIAQGTLVPTNDIAGIYTSPKFDGVLQLSNCALWGYFTNVMRFEGPGSVSISQASIRNNVAGKPAIDIIRGRASVSNSFFNCKGPHIKAGKEVKKVFINGNFADGGMEIINNARDRLTATNNE